MDVACAIQPFERVDPSRDEEGRSWHTRRSRDDLFGKGLIG